MNTSNRLLYLDNLKVCLTVLVIFHHAGQAYGDGGGWASSGIYALDLAFLFSQCCLLYGVVLPDFRLLCAYEFR